MEKTPNQYLQWRYANGDDREVLMKQTRVLTPEDKAQMEKFVDLGDGKGARRIENLMGRQKYKKSFQYEVYVTTPLLTDRTLEADYKQEMDWHAA